jgi:hypothetical protein
LSNLEAKLLSVSWVVKVLRFKKPEVIVWNYYFNSNSPDWYISIELE